MPQSARDVWNYLAAHGLAIADGRTTLDPDTLPPVGFWRAGCCYHLPRLRVQTVCPWQQSMPFPLAPAWILGVVRIAGQVVGVLDVATLHHAARVPVEPGAVLVLVELDGIAVGLLADRLEPASVPGDAWSTLLESTRNVCMDKERNRR